MSKKLKTASKSKSKSKCGHKIVVETTLAAAEELAASLEKAEADSMVEPRLVPLSVIQRAALYQVAPVVVDPDAHDMTTDFLMSVQESHLFGHVVAQAAQYDKNDEFYRTLAANLLKYANHIDTTDQLRRVARAFAAKLTVAMSPTFKFGGVGHQNVQAEQPAEEPVE